MISLTMSPPMPTPSSEQPRPNERADNADDDVTDDPETRAPHDPTRQPTCDQAD